MRSALETTTTTMSPLVSLHPSTSSERVPRPTKEGKMCAQLRREEEFFCHSPPSHKMPFPQCCPRRRQGEEGNEYTKLAAGYPSSTFLWGKPRAMQNALYGDTQNVVALHGITLKRLNGKVVVLALTHDWGNSCAMLYKSMLSFTLKGR